MPPLSTSQFPHTQRSHSPKVHTPTCNSSSLVFHFATGFCKIWSYPMERNVVLWITTFTNAILWLSSESLNVHWPLDVCPNSSWAIWMVRLPGGVWSDSQYKKASQHHLPMPLSLWRAVVGFFLYFPTNIENADDSCRLFHHILLNVWWCSSSSSSIWSSNLFCLQKPGPRDHISYLYFCNKPIRYIAQIISWNISPGTSSSPVYAGLYKETAATLVNLRIWNFRSILRAMKRRRACALLLQLSSGLEGAVSIVRPSVSFTVHRAQQKNEL